MNSILDVLGSQIHLWKFAIIEIIIKMIVMGHAWFLYFWNWFIIRFTTYWFEFKKIFSSLNLDLPFKMKYKFHFQNANFLLLSNPIKKLFHFKILYFRIQIKNYFIFKIQTIFTFKFDSKLAFVYKYQHVFAGSRCLSMRNGECLHANTRKAAWFGCFTELAS